MRISPNFLGAYKDSEAKANGFTKIGRIDKHTPGAEYLFFK
jgi:hypothetical protein